MTRDDKKEAGGSVFLLLTTLSFRYLISLSFGLELRWDVRGMVRLSCKRAINICFRAVSKLRPASLSDRKVPAATPFCANGLCISVSVQNRHRKMGSLRPIFDSESNRIARLDSQGPISSRQATQLRKRYQASSNDKRRFSPNKPTYACSPFVRRQLKDDTVFRNEDASFFGIDFIG